jgi:DNA-binding CsgD family transcriptional regulator/tetratricopeptide (TPR) repeat protein
VGRIYCPDFVGRVVELEALEAALGRAGAGGAPTVLVGGEAGIGKSRLVGEFSRQVQPEVLVLSGACAPFGSSPPPFTPVVEALRAYAHNTDEQQRAELSAMAPSLTRLLPELDVEAAAKNRRESSDPGQSLIFAQLLTVLEEVAKRQPLVVVLEDLHWADRSTLDLLALRSQTARAPACLIVATFRSDELDPGHPLRLTLAELQRSGRTDVLELTRFGRNELVAQLTGILGHPPEYAVVEQILQRSDGNPFLAEELLAAETEVPGGAPARIRDIVMARVETLSEPTQRMLDVLSAAPRSMTHRHLATASEMPEHDLEHSLHEALARHVLVRTGEDAYEFRHALVREATYDALLVEERRRLHLKLAQALDAARTTRGDMPSQLLADRAHHWYHAGDQRRALQSAVEAGLAAEEIYAHAEALTQYERALELWDHVEDSEQLVGIDGVALRARAAEAASSLGEPLRAAHMIERALEDVDAAADPVRAGLLRERLGRYSWIGGDTAYALAAYGEAVRVIPSARPSAERARALAALAHAEFIANRYRVAQALGLEGLEVARAVGAHTEEARALATLGAAVAALGDRRAGLEMVREGRALLENAHSSPDLVFVTYSYESDSLSDGGAFDAAVEAVRPGIELMRRQGMHRSHQSWLEGVEARALVKLGRWTEAAVLMDAALERGPAGITRRMVQLQRAELQLGRGDIVTASQTLADARRAAEGDHPFAGKLFELTAWLTSTQRDFASARLTVGRGLAALDGLDDVHANAWLCWRGLQVEADRAEDARAHRRRAETAAAVRVGEDLLARVHALDALPAARALAELPALKLSCAAELERAAGRGTTESWLGAAGAWKSLREPYPRARCLARAAEGALAERRAKPEIAEWLASAQEIAIELGAAPLVQTLESTALRGRLIIQRRRSEAPAPAPASPLGLTPREIDVLRLVGQGYTNARIAETLFISQKTAATHVSNILGKLEVERRAEAAAIAARVGLLDEPSPQAPRG